MRNRNLGFPVKTARSGWPAPMFVAQETTIEPKTIIFTAGLLSTYQRLDLMVTKKIKLKELRK